MTFPRHKVAGVFLVCAFACAFAPGLARGESDDDLRARAREILALERRIRDESDPAAKKAALKERDRLEEAARAAARSELRRDGKLPRGEARFREARVFGGREIPRTRPGEKNSDRRIPNDTRIDWRDRDRLNMDDRHDDGDREHDGDDREHEEEDDEEEEDEHEPDD